MAEVDKEALRYWLETAAEEYRGRRTIEHGPGPAAFQWALKLLTEKEPDDG